MWLTEAAIKRPVFIIMFILALVFLGSLTRSGMPQELNPRMDYPMVTVSTAYNGAGPNEIESLITERIEKAVSTTSRLKNVTSTSQDGLSQVRLEFELGTDLEAATADIRDKVSAIQNQLPDTADTPRVSKMDVSSSPVISIALAGPLSPREMRILADNVIADRLAKADGVAAVNVRGGEQREISVAVDKARLDAYGLGISSVVDALSATNLNVPAGSIDEDNRTYTVRTVGAFTSLEDIKNTRIPLPGSTATIPVQRVAEVADTVAEQNSRVRLNGESTVLFSVQKQSDANTVDVADGVKKELAALEPTLPAGVHAIVSNDQSTAVKDALRDVNQSLAEGILLVVLIVFLFLHSARATFIVALAIPTSLMATYIPTGVFGFTQNTMLLLGLSLSVGILVDDSIVVLENIERHLRRREKPAEAAANGRSEIGLAAITITLVDVAVFLPIAFMGGIAGQFFRQFGVTVACATAFSLLMSFTLTPMLASRIMAAEEEKERKEEARKHRRAKGTPSLGDWAGRIMESLFAGIDSFLRFLDQAYRSLLEWALHNRFLTLVIGNVSLLVVFAMAMPPAVGEGGRLIGPRLYIALGALGAAALAMVINRKSKGLALGFGLGVAIIALTIYLPFGFTFFPTEDQGQFGVSIMTAPGTSLAATDQVVRQVEKVLQQLPELKPVRFTVSDTIWYNPLSWSKSHSETQTGYVVATVGSGGGGNNGPQYANLSVQVVGKTHRKRSLDDIIGWVSLKTAHIPGAVRLTVSASSGMGGGGGAGSISKDIQGQSMDAILAEAQLVANIMQKTPGTANVDISYKPTLPGHRIVVDQVKAAQLGLNVAQVAKAAQVALAGNTSVQYRDNGTEYPVRVWYDSPDRSRVLDVEHLIVATRNGAPVYLSDVAQVVYETAPAKIDRANRQRVVTVSAGVARGYQMGNVNQEIDNALRRSVVVPGTTVKSGGMTQMMQDTFGYMGKALGIAVILVYMLMSALFESMLTPFVIMFCLPQALVGALAALLLTGTPMGITAMIGIIMLIGLVMKNAILLIDYTNTLMDRGKGRHDALLEAGETRLRPILMTTLAMIGGMMPTALALSEGSESRAPMAIVVIGGLILSTMLTLVVIPVVFTLVDDVWKWVGKKLLPRRAAEPTNASEAAVTEA